MKKIKFNVDFENLTQEKIKEYQEVIEKILLLEIPGLTIEARWSEEEYSIYELQNFNSVIYMSESYIDYLDEKPEWRNTFHKL